MDRDSFDLSYTVKSLLCQQVNGVSTRKWALKRSEFRHMGKGGVMAKSSYNFYSG